MQRDSADQLQNECFVKYLLIRVILKGANFIFAC